MTNLPHIPESAPFTLEQRAWLNGFLAALFSEAGTADGGAVSHPAPASPAQPLLVMYGSQTGTAEQLAKRLAQEAARRGFAPRVLELNAYASVDLARESRLAVITSTWGDGDPPDNAVAFWDYLNSNAAPKLDHLTYSVLALGDRNYSDFCGAGKKFDERLAHLGARRVHPRADCDTDYEAGVRSWMEGLWPALSAQSKPVISESVISKSVISKSVIGEPVQNSSPTSISAPANTDSLITGSLITNSLITSHTRSNPFPARLITNRRLNAPGSGKDTRHFEIALEGSDLSYEAGDALGVMPQNCPSLVGEILAALGCDGEEAVTAPSGQETSFRSALLRSYQITKPARSFLQSLAEMAGDVEWKSLLEPARQTDLDKFLHGIEVIDLLLRCPTAKFAPKEFVGLLAKLQPRLYSISSSPKAHPGEVHLTVAAVRYESHGRARKGICSTFLADRVEADTPVPVFIQTSQAFRLPTDPRKPVIMIGPGTGVAPFRAFIEERRATGAPGKNWLFFGDQRKECDFLYQGELEAMLAEGSLARLDTAFSRDQAEKVYVQTRMLEHGAELWSWLEAGAHLYVCGDAKRMAKDVDAALHQIIERAGGRTAGQAADYVQQLKTAKRYQRDVY